jgi:hypothetical protein
MKRWMLTMVFALSVAPLVLADGPTTAPATTRPTTRRARHPMATMPDEIKPNAAIPEDLAKEMLTARRLAMDGKIAELFEAIAPPDLIARMKSEGKFDEMVARFGQNAPMFIDALEQSLVEAPEISNDGTTVTFQGNENHKQMKFTKIGDRWTLR